MLMKDFTEEHLIYSRDSLDFMKFAKILVQMDLKSWPLC